MAYNKAPTKEELRNYYIRERTYYIRALPDTLNVIFNKKHVYKKKEAEIRQKIKKHLRDMDMSSFK